MNNIYACNVVSHEAVREGQTRSELSFQARGADHVKAARLANRPITPATFACRVLSYIEANPLIIYVDERFTRKWHAPRLTPDIGRSVEGWVIMVVSSEASKCRGTTGLRGIVRA